MPVPVPFILAALGVGTWIVASRSKASTPATVPGATTGPAAAIPPDLKVQMDAAMTAMGYDAAGNLTGVVTPEALQAATQLAGEIERRGYKKAADILRHAVTKASKRLPATPPDKSITFPPDVLSADMARAVNNALLYERDPAKLRAILAQLEAMPTASAPSMQMAIGMLRALIAQSEAAQHETRVIKEVDRVITSPTQPAQGHVDIMPVATRPSSPSAPSAPPVVSDPGFPITSPGQPIPGQPALPGAPAPITLPGITPPAIPLPGITLPSAPGLTLPKPPVPEPPPGGVKIPNIPVPQPLPVAKSANAIAAEGLALHLIGLETSKGFPKKAKGSEDTSLVKRFQTLEQLKSDGVAGPGVMLAMAKYIGNLPHVWYWPKGATGKNVDAYRSSLLAEAMRAEAAGDALRAQQLKVSASREDGSGGVSGTVSKAPSVSIQPLPSAPINPPSLQPPVLTDPNLPSGSPPSAGPIDMSPVAQAAQAMFDNIGGLIQKAGGDLTKVKGKEDKKLVAAFQALAGLKADGKPGPGTYLSAARYSVDVPLVLYWPQGSNKQTVTKYRNDMNTVASVLEKTNPVRAQALRLNVAKEAGQGGIAETGPVTPGGKKMTTNV